MQTLKKSGFIFDKIVDYMLLASAVIIVFVAIAVSQDVMTRKFFGFTWNLLFEIISYTLVWITFLGTTAILRSQGHVKMDSLISRLPVRAQALVNFITSCLCSLLLVGIVIYTVKLTVYDYRSHFEVASILNPVKWPIEIIIPIGFLMLFIQMMRNAYGFYQTFRTASPRKPLDQEMPVKEKAFF